MGRRWWFWLFFVFGLVVVFVYLYQFLGFKYHLRALVYVVKQSTWQEKKDMANNLYLSDRKEYYGGTLAGIWGDRIGVWGESGLRIFNTDQYSVYKYYDGCSDAVLSEIASGIRKRPGENTFFERNMNDWKELVRAGDYVVVEITQPSNAGTVGNLRQIYDYNYWPFIQESIYIECAK